MTDPESMRARATDLIAEAQRCRVVAADIDLRRRLLPERIASLRAHHTPEVWQSAAATRSRDIVNGRVGPGLLLVAELLGDTVRRLVDRADRLESMTRMMLDQAAELEIDRLRVESADPVATGTADSIEPDVRDAPLGPAVPPVLARPG